MKPSLYIWDGRPTVVNDDGAWVLNPLSVGGKAWGRVDEPDVISEGTFVPESERSNVIERLKAGFGADALNGWASASPQKADTPTEA